MLSSLHHSLVQLSILMRYKFGNEIYTTCQKAVTRGLVMPVL
jgi:hypothetical protein